MKQLLVAQFKSAISKSKAIAARFALISNTIVGRLLIKLTLHRTLIFSIQFLLVFIFMVWTSSVIEQSLRVHQPHHLSMCDRIYVAVGNQVSSHYQYLLFLAQLLDGAPLDYGLAPMTAENATYSLDLFTQRYKNENNITELEINLNRSIYQNFRDPNQTAIYRVTQIDPLIMDFMFSYDKHKQLYDYYLVVDQANPTVHQFPCVDIIIEESYLQYQKTQHVKRAQGTLEFVTPYSRGVVVGRSSANYLRFFFRNLQSPYYASLITADFKMAFSSDKPTVHGCEEHILGLLASYASLGNTYLHSFDDCPTLYLRLIENDIYLVLYKEADPFPDHLGGLINISWPFYLLYCILMLLSYFFVYHRVVLFSRDITNPIKQVTYKIDKIINNALHLRILNKIQADDILVKEETEAQQLVNDFSKLYESLKQRDLFNFHLSESKQKHEILPKHPDKTIDQVKQLVHRIKGF